MSFLSVQSKGIGDVYCLNRNIQNMKKIFFTLLILSAVSFVRAQDLENPLIENDNQITGSKLKFGLSINPGLNLGRYGSDLVLSGNLGLYKDLTNNLEATFSAGYIGYLVTP